jgi:hypothetical protein
MRTEGAFHLTKMGSPPLENRAVLEERRCSSPKCGRSKTLSKRSTICDAKVVKAGRKDRRADLEIKRNLGCCQYNTVNS